MSVFEVGCGRTRTPMKGTAPAWATLPAAMEFAQTAPFVEHAEPVAKHVAPAQVKKKKKKKTVEISQLQTVWKIVEFPEIQQVLERMVERPQLQTVGTSTNSLKSKQILHVQPAHAVEHQMVWATTREAMWWKIPSRSKPA